MYQYNDFDKVFLVECNKQFCVQVECCIDGFLIEDEFCFLCLMNGLYLQLYVYMLCVVIFYGMLNGVQMDILVLLVEKWDKGYGYFIMCQNI